MPWADILHVTLALAVLTLATMEGYRWHLRRRERNNPPCQPGPLEFGLPETKEPSNAIREYCRHPSNFIQADHVELLTDGQQAYPAMLKEIQDATQSVDLETYILADDETGRKFQQALMAAARGGARVRVIYDWIGSISLSSAFVQEMLDAGVLVGVYHPLVLLRPSWAINRRNHRKMLIVDHDVGFIGGLNISDDYAGLEEGGKGWRDTHVMIHGFRIAAQMEAIFEQDWRRCTSFKESARRSDRLSSGIRRRIAGALRRRRDYQRHAPRLPQPEALAVKILSNQEFRFRRRIRRAYLHAIRNARHYIFIENAYFIPERSIRRELYRAVDRGVVVAVVLAEHSDVQVAHFASRHLYEEMLRHGVRLFEWPRGMMHAKTAVIDDAWAIVGSYNFDHRSLRHQLEAAAVIVDRQFAAALRRQTEADIRQCSELTQHQHRLRPWHHEVAEAFCYLLRKWL